MINNTTNVMGAKRSSSQNTSAHETSKVFFYQGSEITFQNGSNLMVNATEMAKSFKKQPIHWLNNTQTNEYLTELTKLRNLSLIDLVQVNRGGINPGTWFHEDVAIEFARWLSPAFAIWCNDRIKELLTQGVATIANDDEAILHAMQVLQQRVRDSQQKLQMLEGENEIQQQQIKTLAPKAEYTDKVLQSTSTFTATQIAKQLGMSAKSLNSKLKDLGIQFNQSGQWLLYAKYQDKGYADMRVSTYYNRRTEMMDTSQSLVWTEKGRLFIHELREGGKL